jgi:hypothetical protein
MKKWTREPAKRSMGAKLAFVIILLLTCLCVAAFSQQPVVNARLKSELIRIGEQTQLTLKVSYRKENGIRSIRFPELKDTLVGHVEIISKSGIETYAPDKSNPSALVDSQAITITSFDSGYYAIPPLRFYINGDTARPVESEALMLGVNMVKADTTKAPRDIKPPIEEPFTFADALPYIYIGLGVVAIIAALAIFFSRRRKLPAAILPKAPPVPPYVTALRKLEELHDKKLWQEGQLKAYHSGISDILREYIEASFPCNAMELTTDEILYRFRRINVPREAKAQLKQALLLADMVKFAKEVPVAEENELSYVNAVAFVNTTKPSPEDKETEQQTETA